MADKPTHTAESVIAAIKGTAGVKATIARKLNVSRWTVDNYLERWVTVREAYEEEKAGVSDAARSVVIADIVNNRNVETAKWWLRMKERDEFSDKSQTDITSGGDKLGDWRDEVVDLLKNGRITADDVLEEFGPTDAKEMIARANLASKGGK